MCFIIFEANIQISLLYYQAVVIRVKCTCYKRNIIEEVTGVVAVIMTMFDISQIIRSYSCSNEVKLANQYGKITYQLKLNTDIRAGNFWRCFFS
jgi:hypothetical protein